MYIAEICPILQVGADAKHGLKEDFLVIQDYRDKHSSDVAISVSEWVDQHKLGLENG